MGLATGCVAEDVGEPDGGDAFSSQWRSAVSDGESDEDSDGLECGCSSNVDSIQNWDDCDPKDDGKVVKSRQLVVSNCFEVQAPHCDAQFGCEFMTSECICRAELEGSILNGGYYWEEHPHWECTVTDDATLDLEPCAAE